MRSSNPVSPPGQVTGLIGGWHRPARRTRTPTNFSESIRNVHDSVRLLQAVASSFPVNPPGLRSMTFAGSGHLAGQSLARSGAVFLPWDGRILSEGAGIST